MCSRLASSQVHLFHNNKLVAALIWQSRYQTEDEGKRKPEFVLAESEFVSGLIQLTVPPTPHPTSRVIFSTSTQL